MLGIPNENLPKKKRRIRITFNEDEEVINPEDVDPTVGRFRNMVETSVIPKKVQYEALSIEIAVLIPFFYPASPLFWSRPPRNSRAKVSDLKVSHFPADFGQEDRSQGSLRRPQSPLV